MNTLEKILIYCSGVDNKILSQCPTDTNKYVGLGATVFFTGLMAWVAAGFALYTIFHSIPIAIIFGLIWGAMIFNLDRFIVTTMKKGKSILSNVGITLPRLALAVVIALVISKPLELKVFESEIRSEIALMEQEAFKEQEKAVAIRYDDDMLSVKKEIQQINNEINKSYNHYKTKEAEALAEADGTGGSQIRNMGPIYMAKKKSAEEALIAHEDFVKDQQPKLTKLTEELNGFQAQKTASLSALARSPLDGFAAQMEALGRLCKKSQTILFASFFITLLFICIETTPILSKLISARSPYDYELDTIEQQYAFAHKSINSKLALDTETELQYLNSTTKFQSTELAKAENEIFLHALGKKVQEEKEKTLSWSEILKGLRLKV